MIRKLLNMIARSRQAEDTVIEARFAALNRPLRARRSTHAPVSPFRRPVRAAI